MIFKRGDLCRVRDVKGVQRLLRGRECVVLTPLRNVFGKRRHQIEMTDMDLPAGSLAYAIPEHLEKLPPPYLRLKSWDDCIWQPRASA